MEVKVFLFASVKGHLLSRGLSRVMEVLTIWPKCCLPDLSFVMTPVPLTCPLPPTHPHSIFWESVTKSNPCERGANFFHLPLNYKHVFISL